MVLKYIQRLFDDWIIKIDVLGPCLLVQHIVDDTAVDNAVKELV